MSKLFGPSKKDIEKMIDKKVKMIDKKVNSMEAMIDNKVNAEHESNKKARRTIKAQLSKLIEKNKSDIDQLQPAVVSTTAYVEELKKKVEENSKNIALNSSSILKLKIWVVRESSRRKFQDALNSSSILKWVYTTHVSAHRQTRETIVS